MQVTYTVNGVSPQTRPSVATVNGVDMAVVVPEIEVELVDPTNQWGTLTLHFRSPDERDYALATYTPGGTATVTF